MMLLIPTLSHRMVSFPDKLSIVLPKMTLQLPNLALMSDPVSYKLKSRVFVIISIANRLTNIRRVWALTLDSAQSPSGS